MTPADAAKLLTVAAAYDNRKPDPDQAKAWALALNGLDFVACRDAIVAHYQRTRDWIMPADVRGAVRRERAARIEDDVVPMPADLDPDDTAAYVAVLREGRRALAEGRSLPAPPPAAPGHAGRLRALLAGQAAATEGGDG